MTLSGGSKSRTLLAAAGLAAGLTAALTLGPVAAQGATIDTMAAQGDVALGSQACAGPFEAGAKDIVAASGSAFQLSKFGVPVGVPANFELRRGEPGTDFFSDAKVVQRATTDFFATSVQAGDPLLPGAFWVCVSAAPGDVVSRVPVHYKLFLGNGLPA
ncbi:unnamed protein product [[Actinomadura] parvosata subsp. kistnae]|uniref:Secreted protein n=1 Tax=[Actinomadura] parvosata subsp. kistnae TaxID=1909395 RepID=A0A1U9ZUL3_9ACTN|nr:hypothetical protein [Nonomuraea sp. ATCC 55076]AQZ61634.1 hypothetical protein BKM31_09280 [Nonomuraea sp. ATCC 55076]SPL87734.1 unnamed protein product [Actinomadura parvosata subsp. kistnae]